MDNIKLIATLHILDAQGKKRHAGSAVCVNSEAIVTETEGTEILHAVNVLAQHFNIGIKLTTDDSF